MPGPDCGWSLRHTDNKGTDMRYDYTSMGFYTFDCLGRPVSEIPPGGDTYFIEELTMAVSGAAGSAAIVGAKHGLKTLAVGGVGEDDMGDWVLARLEKFGVDTSCMARCSDAGTSSSIVTTRPDGQRPALHMKGATGSFVVGDDQLDQVLDGAIIHIGGAGLMDRMDGEPCAELMREAKSRQRTTTLDVFAATSDDLDGVKMLLPHTDYFLPSIEEAQALSGLTEHAEVADFFLGFGVTCCVLTLGELGAYYHHGDGTRFYSPAFDIDVVCTCGCGDAFNAGFASGLHHGLDPDGTVELAQACSALNATGLGSQAGVKNYDQTRAFARDTPKKG